MSRNLTPDWPAAPEAVPYANLADPQSLNLYAYVMNNPVTAVDAFGHQHCTATGPNGCPTPAPSGTKMASRQATTVRVHHWTFVHNANGTETDIETTTSLTFSTAEGHQGQFLGATTQTTTFQEWTRGAGRARAVQPISYGQAVRAVGGPGEMSMVAQAVAPTASGIFFRVVGHDIREHPGKYVFYGVEAAAALAPLPEAYEGYEMYKAVADVAVSGVHLIWDLAH